MDIAYQLSIRPYYNDYSRKFPHYYEIHYTNTDKIDYIMIESLQKGFKADEVLLAMDKNWEDCIKREKEYESHESDSSHQSYFEAYLRSVIRKILVFDDFERIFTLV